MKSGFASHEVHAGWLLDMQMNLATVAVLHTAMALEDPFDNQGLDGTYVDEALFEAEQVAEHLMSCIFSLISPLTCGL